MSAHDLHAHDGANEPHATRKDYVTGFMLAAILTAIPFAVVMGHVLSAGTTAFAVMALAAVQVVVHMVYFLHMNSRSEGGCTPEEVPSMAGGWHWHQCHR